MSAPAIPSPSPQQIVMQMLSGRSVSRALSLAAELGVADHMKNEPVAIDALASATGTNADALHRLLRALSALGVFAESEGRAFALTPLSQCLRTDAPGSIRPMALWQNEDAHWAAWGQLDAAVKTGKPAFDAVHKMQVFDYFREHPSTSKIFDEAMGSITQSVGPAVARAYDFSKVKHLVDVGGSQGVLLSAVLDKFPEVRATLFDLDHVIADAQKKIAQGRHKGRIEAVAGSFLDGVPKGADAYIMKSIIHDWDDAHCVKLLSHCRASMAPGGRVLIVEGVITNSPASTPTKFLDLEMLVMTTGGRERTEPEFDALLRKAGLKLTRIVPTESMMSVIEAQAA